MMYTKEGIEELERECSLVASQYHGLLFAYAGRTFSDARAREYATQGFARRVGTLARCIYRVFEIVPPDRTDSPTRDELVDTAIYLQAFMFNLFGALDNLAWVWVSEKGIKKENGSRIPNSGVGLGEKNVDVRRSVSPEFQECLREFNDWFAHLENYRHALAHRIPLYVPPSAVPKRNWTAARELEERKAQTKDLAEYERLSAEQDALGVFRPVIMHSYEEGADPVNFHPQLLCDFKTVVLLGNKMLEELDR